MGTLTIQDYGACYNTSQAAEGLAKTNESQAVN